MPKSRFDELGITEELGTNELPVILLEQFLENQEVDKETVLLQVAKKSLTTAIDLLWVASAGSSIKLEGDKLANLAVRALDYATHNPHPSWLEQAQNDQQFLRDLEHNIDCWQLRNESIGNTVCLERYERLGNLETWFQIQEGARRIKGVITRLPSPLLNFSRPWLHRSLTRFVGDIFVYLKERGTSQDTGDIVGEIIHDLERARDAIHDTDDRLIIVAHSMGGNIMYDILTYFRPDIQVDWLITVGSQVALFEEMKLFHISNQLVPENPNIDRVNKPQNVANWLNIVDYNDVLSFVAEGVFNDVKDLSYETGQGILAHGAYFQMPSFHERLGKRIREASR